MRIGTKLAAGVIALIFTILAVVTVGSIYLINDQGRKSGEELLNVAMTFIHEEIDKRFQDIFNSNAILTGRENVKSYLSYVNDFRSLYYSKEGKITNSSILPLFLDPTKDIAREIADYLVSARNLEQVSLLDKDGHPLAIAAMNDKNIDIFALSPMKLDSLAYISNSAPIGAFFPSEWLDSGSPGLDLVGNVEQDNSIGFLKSGRTIFVVGTTVIRDAKGLTLGAISSAKAIDEVFIRQISSMIKVDVNQFIDRELAYGTLKDFNAITPDTLSSINAARTPVSSNPSYKFLKSIFDITIADTPFYQGFLSLYLNDDSYLGGFSVLISQEKTRAQTTKALLFLFAILAASIVLVSLGIWLSTAKLVTGPLNKLIEPIREITAGNLDAQIIISQNDEIGFLAKHFETMRVKVKALTDNLQSQVAERTQKLEQALQQVTQEKETIQKMSSKLVHKNRELKEMQTKLAATAHQAGMAEIATGILHNIGNVLNSINTSSGIVKGILDNSEMKLYSRTASMLEQHQNNLAEYLANDPKGPKFVQMLLALNKPLNEEQAQINVELDRVLVGIGVIRDVISSQQDYAKAVDYIQEVGCDDLVREVLKIIESSLTRHSVKVTKNFRNSDKVFIEKNKILNVLLNLIKNAKESMIEAKTSDTDRLIEITTGKVDGLNFIQVKDNGIGIARENIDRVFNHGFTTKAKGHGFGLHSCANALAEMGGKINVISDGIGHGATFTVYFPSKHAKAKVEEPIRSIA